MKNKMIKKKYYLIFGILLFVLTMSFVTIPVWRYSIYVYVCAITMFGLFCLSLFIDIVKVMINKKKTN